MTKQAIVFRIRSLLGSTLSGFRLLKLLNVDRNHKRLLFNSKTAICIEGYPRCANTFAVLAFEAAQPKPLVVAHHMHLSGQILSAVKQDTPVIVLIRDPLDACISLHLREPGLSPDLCLQLYLEFHEPLLPHLSSIVVAPFERVTSNYAEVIEQVNQRFGSNFTPYINSPASDKKILESMDNLPLRENEYTVARPTAEKRTKKKELMTVFNGDQYKTLLEACKTVYSHFEDAVLF